MWTPVRIRVKDLFTHKDTQYNIKTGEMSVFIGLNLDKRGANSNGAGKSALLEGIMLAITGEVFRDLTPDKFIRRGQETCEVEQELYNRVLNKKMLIKRQFHRIESSKVQVYIDDVKVKKLVGVRAATKFIFDELGISSKEDLFNYYILGQGNSNSFFKASDTKQKEIIGRFCNYSVLDKVSVELDKKIKDIEESIQSLNLQIGKVETLIEAYNEEKEEVQNSDNSDEEETIRLNIVSFDKKLKNKKVEKVRIGAELEEKRSILEEKKKEVNEQAISDVKKLRSINNEEIEVVGEEIRKNKKLVNQLSMLLGNEIQCPKCDEKFIPESELSIEEVNIKINELNLLIGKKKKKLLDLEEKELKFEKEIKQLKQSQKAVEHIEGEVEQLVINFNRVESDMSYYSNKILELNKELENLTKNNSIKSKIVEIDSKLKNQINNLNSLNKQRDMLITEIEKVKKLNFHMSKSGFRTYLANLSIRHIQDVTNYYLQKFDTGIQVKINGFTVLRTGELRDKIEVIIVEDGMDESVYSQNSGGEKSRVDMACLIALNTLMNNSAEHGKGLDMLFIDEGIQYMDANGQAEALKILSNSGITSIIVMHQIEDLQFPNKVWFVKKNKKTTIQFNKPKEFKNKAA